MVLCGGCFPQAPGGIFFTCVFNLVPGHVKLWSSGKPRRYCCVHVYRAEQLPQVSWKFQVAEVAATKFGADTFAVPVALL